MLSLVVAGTLLALSALHVVTGVAEYVCIGIAVLIALSWRNDGSSWVWSDYGSGGSDAGDCG